MRQATLTIAAAAALACTGAGAATQAQPALHPQSISYAAQDLSFPLGYVITWYPSTHTVHVSETFGTSDGTYTDDGVTRIVTLQTPLVSTGYKIDCNGNYIEQTDDALQLVFRTTSGDAERGTTQIVPMGTLTDIGGCTPGLVTPYGSVTDAGFTLNRLDMSLRAPMDDLVPGARLVGMSEVPLDMPGDGYTLAADRVTFGEHDVRFAATGHRFNFTRTADGWFVIDFGTFQRGYTRLTRDATSGEEIWLASEWTNGAPGTISMSAMVTPRPGARFGGVKMASHDWVSGHFLNSYSPNSFDLYRDGSGQRVTSFTDGSAPLLAPFTWSQSGAQMLLNFPAGDGSYSVRTWTPVADYGRNHFVLESMNVYDAAGNFLYESLPARVNFMIDDGKSVEPASPAAAPAAHRATARDLRHRAD